MRSTQANDFWEGLKRTVSSMKMLEELIVVYDLMCMRVKPEDPKRLNRCLEFKSSGSISLYEDYDGLPQAVQNSDMIFWDFPVMNAARPLKAPSCRSVYGWQRNPDCPPFMVYIKGGGIIPILEGMKMTKLWMTWKVTWRLIKDMLLEASQMLAK